jgi:hypothetical protein
MQYCHCRVADSSFGSMRGRGSSIQHCHLVCNPPVVVDALVIIVGLLTSPVVALELHATGVVESFEAKPPDFAALEVGQKGAALVCSRRSAQLAPKCHGGTFKLSVPRRRTPQQGGLEAVHGSPKIVFLVSWSSLHCCFSSWSLQCVRQIPPVCLV